MAIQKQDGSICNLSRSPRQPAGRAVREQEEEKAGQRGMCGKEGGPDGVRSSDEYLEDEERWRNMKM